MAGPPRFFVEGAPAVQRRLVAGWEPTDRWDFALWWRRQVPSRSVFAQLPPGARINHLPGIAALTSPARLAERLDRARQRLAGRPGALPPVLRGARDEPTEGTSHEILVLIAGIDPLRVFAYRGPAGLDREACATVDALVLATIAAAYDDLARGAQGDLVDAGAGFELVRFDVVLPPSGAPKLVGCVLSPSIDDAIAAAALARLEIVPGDPTAFAPLHAPSMRAFARTCAFPRWADLAAADLDPGAIAALHRASSRVLDGAIVLFQEETSRFHVLNDAAGFVWIRTQAGATPGEVAAALAAQFAIEAGAARRDVWDALARWGADGWIAMQGDEASAYRERDGEVLEPRCLLAAHGAVVARGAEPAVALVGEESSGVTALAAVLSATGAATVVSGETWIDEETGAATPSSRHLAVFEGDDAIVAALSPAFAASPRTIAPSELGVRFYEPALGTHLLAGAAPVIGPIVVVRRAGRGEAPSLLPLRPRDLLLALVRLGLRAEPAWSTARAHSLLEWLEETPAFTLVAADPGAAAAHVLAWMTAGMDGAGMQSTSTEGA